MSSPCFRLAYAVFMLGIRFSNLWGYIILGCLSSKSNACTSFIPYLFYSLFLFYFYSSIYYSKLWHIYEHRWSNKTISITTDRISFSICWLLYRLKLYIIFIIQYCSIISFQLCCTAQSSRFFLLLEIRDVTSVIWLICIPIFENIIILKQNSNFMV